MDYNSLFLLTFLSAIIEYKWLLKRRKLDVEEFMFVWMGVFIVALLLTELFDVIR